MIKVSIIIVNYKVKKELFACIESIIQGKPTTPHEIIVVDNDERKTIYADLSKKFPKIKYVPNENKGYGAGNNLGATYAKGQYLFILNPDTKLEKNCIDLLTTYLERHKDVGIVAPVLYDRNNKPPLQGAHELTPLRAIFTFSFLNKIFPKNPITKEYWVDQKWDKKSAQEVGSVPGAAFMIRKEIFEKVDGFDEGFFLYFEEHDLCKRVVKVGWKLVMCPQAKVFHVLGGSTKQSKRSIQNIFVQSRFYYFRKHFGVLPAFCTEAVLRTGKYAVMLGAVVILGFFLRIYNSTAGMPFIGDQAWFYLSARDMLLTGHVPLVGIVSSHPWLHQGALWTYMLGVGFWIFGFSPFVGIYISVFLGVLGILGMYGLGSMMFSPRVGVIAAALFATSPLVIASDRMPYHTSPIPLFVIIFIYFLYRWVSGNARFFPLVIFTLGVLYNFEIATVLLSFVVALVGIYGFFKREHWAVGIFSAVAIYSLWAFFFSMLPMLIYDSSRGFPQTAGVVTWLGYKLLLVFGYSVLHPSTTASWSEMLGYSVSQLKSFIFPYSGLVAVGIFVGSVLVLGIKYKVLSIRLILILNTVLLAGFFAGRTPSHAYLPMMFPGVILMTALLFDNLIVAKRLKWFAVIGLVTILSSNVYYFFVKNRSENSFEMRLAVVKYIVKEAGQKEYNLIGSGEGSQFKSFTMSYEYLAWWLCSTPSKKVEKLRFIISEENGIRIEKKEVGIKK